MDNENLILDEALADESTYEDGNIGTKEDRTEDEYGSFSFLDALSLMMKEE